jgi:hypothetical protein
MMLHFTCLAWECVAAPEPLTDAAKSVAVVEMSPLREPMVVPLGAACSAWGCNLSGGEIVKSPSLLLAEAGSVSSLACEVEALNPASSLSSPAKDAPSVLAGSG